MANFFLESLTGNVTSDSYSGRFLEPEDIPFTNAYPEVWNFQHVNASSNQKILHENHVKNT